MLEIQRTSNAQSAINGIGASGSTVTPAASGNTKTATTVPSVARKSFIFLHAMSHPKRAYFQNIKLSVQLLDSQYLALLRHCHLDQRRERVQEEVQECRIRAHPRSAPKYLPLTLEGLQMPQLPVVMRKLRTHKCSRLLFWAGEGWLLTVLWSLWCTLALNCNASLTCKSCIACMSKFG